MGEQDRPAIADPVVKIDRALGRLGREIRRFVVDAQGHDPPPLLACHRRITVSEYRGARTVFIRFSPPLSGRRRNRFRNHPASGVGSGVASEKGLTIVLSSRISHGTLSG